MTDQQSDTVVPDPTSDLPTSVRRTSPLWRLPVLRELRSSVGLQRGMLLTGLVIVAVVVLVAVFVPLIAPYGYSQLSDGNFRVRVINVAASTSRDFSLDWLAVRVTYQPVP